MFPPAPPGTPRGQAVECGAGGAWNRGRRGHDRGEFGPEQSGIGPGEEQRNAHVIGWLVAMAVRYALDDAVKAEAATIHGAAARWPLLDCPWVFRGCWRVDPDVRQGARITMAVLGANRCPAPLPAARPNPAVL